VTLTRRSSLADVAFAVGSVLRRHRIRAVLTGGACVALHTDGAYISHDLDFILQGPEVVAVARLDTALGELGFHRRGNQYRHPRLSLYVEFPPGPLAIGGDHSVTPVELRRRRQVLRALSATDACLDRLAAFYHWDDRQSLTHAVEISRRRRVNLKRVAAWSAAEGQRAKHQEFLQERRRAQRATAADRPARHRG
jgi:hypothetical protein